MNYSIEFSRPAQKSLKKIPRADLLKIKRKIDQLMVDPYPTGYKELSGYKNLNRIRVGDFRILYRVQKKQVVIYVIDVGHRKNVYSRL